MQGCSLDPRLAGIEHDIMESFDPGEVLPHAFHANGYGADYLGFRVPRKPKGVTNAEHNKANTVKLDTEEFHTFGMLWEPDGYTFYIDGKQRGPKVGCGEGEAVSQTDEFVLVTTEAKWYRNNRMTGMGILARLLLACVFFLMVCISACVFFDCMYLGLCLFIHIPSLACVFSPPALLTYGLCLFAANT